MVKLKESFSLILILIIITIPYGIRAQKYSTHIANYITKVEHPFTFLQKVEHLGIKESGTKELDSTYNWLLKLIKTEGYQTITQKFLNNKDTLRNIEFVKYGTSDSCIILCAHYDSWIGPGVNDNGTGDFALYQFAKLIRPLKTKYTIRFIYFSGEEIGFLGSKHYVSNINKNYAKIKYVINFDQLGGTIGENNSAIKCERDQVSSRQAESNIVVEQMAMCYSLYTDLTPLITPTYSSDYIPFRDSGYVIAGVYQYSPFPYYHSSSDLLNYIEFPSLISTVKGALAFILHFSQVDPSTWDVQNIKIKRDLTVYSTSNELVILNGEGYNMSVYDQLGRECLTKTDLARTSQFSLRDLNPGIYFAYLRSGPDLTFKKFFVNP